MASTTRVADSIAQATTVTRNKQFDATCYPSLKQELKASWDEGVVLSVDSINRGVCDEWFDKIYRQHNQTGRYYHTAVHLKEILDYLKILKQNGVLKEIQLHIVLIWATFFHDVVYDPKSNSNEKASAAMFQEFCLQVAMPLSVSKMIESLILATEKHQVIPTSDESISLEQRELQTVAQELFLDLDMAVLGKESDAYISYATLIRKEYAFVPAHLYCSRRAEILQLFLDDSKTIYVSNIFQDALEQRARSNLQQEIHLLKQGLIPGEKTP